MRPPHLTIMASEGEAWGGAQLERCDIEEGPGTHIERGVGTLIERGGGTNSVFGLRIYQV